MKKDATKIVVHWHAVKNPEKDITHISGYGAGRTEGSKYYIRLWYGFDKNKNQITGKQIQFSSFAKLLEAMAIAEQFILDKVSSEKDDNLLDSTDLFE